MVMELRDGESLIRRLHYADKTLQAFGSRAGPDLFESAGFGSG